MFIFQDGRIDYNEFAAMMHNGNNEMGKKGGHGRSFSIGFREALQVCWHVERIIFFFFFSFLG